MSSEGARAGHLRRSVGFYGLMFVSLGSIIGSGWLLGALNAAEVAGPASSLSWLIAAAMLATLALTYAELGAAYPVAGGAGRFPYYAHGPVCAEEPQSLLSERQRQGRLARHRRDLRPRLPAARGHGPGHLRQRGVR